MERIDCSTRTVRVILTAYIDRTSAISFGGGQIVFGDGESLFVPELNPVVISSDVGRVTFEVTHTFPSDGIYTVSYAEPNRNDNIVNITGSVSTPFYMESSLLVSLSSACNQTPTLTVPPIDRACTGQAFFHIPGAVDPEGDSLHYSLIIPKSSRENVVQEFQPLIDFSSENENGGPPEVSIDPSTGLLRWDAPGMTGEYVIAIRIDEYRKSGDAAEWVGSTVRDMQILVSDCSNRRPVLTPAIDTCITAGTDFLHELLAMDPDNDSIRIELFGELSFIENLITDIPTGFFAGPSQTFEVSWQPGCGDIRGGTYVMVFKITDKSPTADNDHIPLSSFVTWKINVLTSSPEPQEISLAPNGLLITWDDYIPCAPLEAIEVYRRVGNENIPFSSCLSGLPANSGYEKIADLPPGSVEYLDNTLIPAATLCYRLVARSTDGARSTPSGEICFDFIPADRPVLTHVSIETTDKEAGQVAVGWRKPLSLELPEGPHNYTIERRTPESAYEEVARISVSAALDSIGFRDTNLNTSDSVYLYRILFATAIPDRAVPPSEPASTVRLNLIPEQTSVSLTWQAEVPWSNKISGLLHSTFKTDDNNTTIVEEVNPLIQGYSFKDEDIEVSRVYCYRVATRGSYGNDIISGPFVNYSQTTCIRLGDEIPPGMVTLSPTNRDCAQEYADGIGPSSNTLQWETLGEDDINYYEIQFKADYDSEYEFLVSVNDQNFIHFFERLGDQPVSLKGCYQVRAVDFSGNVGPWSDELCIDNCTNLEFPNILTPNNDGCNEVFYPFSSGHKADCGPGSDPSKNIRFAEYLTLRIYNRWGEQVYANEGNPTADLNVYWDGRDDQGEELPTGVYYYEAQAKFNALPEKTERRKGWVQLLR